MYFRASPDFLYTDQRWGHPCAETQTAIDNDARGPSAESKLPIHICVYGMKLQPISRWSHGSLSIYMLASTRTIIQDIHMTNACELPHMPENKTMLMFHLLACTSAHAQSSYSTWCCIHAGSYTCPALTGSTEALYSMSKNWPDVAPMHHICHTKLSRK